MGPVRQNPIQRTVSLFICVCIALCTIVAHNIAQNRPDSFPPYPPDDQHCSDDVYLREGGAMRPKAETLECVNGHGGRTCSVIVTLGSATYSSTVVLRTKATSPAPPAMHSNAPAKPPNGSLHVQRISSRSPAHLLHTVVGLLPVHCTRRLPVNSSHGRLVTRSTRHIMKPPQCRAVRFNYLGLMSLYQ